MGSLSITPFSCTHQVIHKTIATMKVFATLATILGVAYATPEARMPQQVVSMRSGLQQHNNVMGMSSGNIMSNMRMASPYQAGPIMVPQAQEGPRQYHLQDEFGNFEYAYANQDSEKMEKGNDMSVRGRYAYIMSDGLLRRVEYIADNDGFHVLQDNADNSRSQERIKRSVEPDLIQTRMTSYMDTSALRDDSMVNPNVYNMMGRDMSSNMMQRNRMNQMSSQRNMYGMMDRSSNMMDKNMRDNDMMGRNMMDQNMYSNMGGRDISSNTLNRNMIGQQDVSNMRNRNMIGQEMIDEKMMGRNIMGNNVYSNLMGRDMSSNLMNPSMIGQDMLNRNMMSQEMSYNMMGRDMSSNMINAYGNDVNMLPLGQRNTMSQQMLIGQIPQMTVASRNTFF